MLIEWLRRMLRCENAGRGRVWADLGILWLRLGMGGSSVRVSRATTLRLHDLSCCLYMHCAQSGQVGECVFVNAYISSIMAH